MKRMMGAVLVLMLAGAVFGEGRKIRVPKHYPNIQTAINFAEDGDTVIVADGVWSGASNKNLDFLGHNITVRSKNGPDACTIDCEDDGRGFFLHRGEGNAAQIIGFTITSGNSGLGGAIACQRASPTISGCILRNNTALTGGALYCSDYTNVVIQNCLITKNEAGSGAGIYLTGNENEAQIRNCTVSENTAEQGGGLLFGSHSSPIATSCVIWKNIPDSIEARPDATPIVQYTLIQGGWPGTHNIDADPLFVVGPRGEFYLSQRKAGQDKTSLAVNNGLGTAKQLGLKKTTTRTDRRRDKRAVDMGWHYPR